VVTLAFADATAVVSADFSRFQREFGPRLRDAVNRALPGIVRAFTQAGRAAGKAFVDGFTSQLDKLIPAARKQGSLAGRAFELAAETHTKDIDVAFNIPDARATVLGRQFRAAVAKQTQRIPVTFATKPNARTVGQITGRRFRLGAQEFTLDIPVSFKVDKIDSLGRRAGQRFRTAAERETENIQARVNAPRSTGLDSSGGFFSTLTRLSGNAIRSVTRLRGALALLGAVGIVPAATLVANLAPLVGLIAALPAALFTATAGFIVLGVSMERISTLVADNLVPAFEGLRDRIARAATAGFAQQLKILGDNLRGPVTQGALTAANALNELLLGIIQFGQTRATGSAIVAVFNSTAASIRNIAAALPSVLAGFRDITVAVLPALNGMSATFGQLLGQFGRFLTTSAQSGQALAWVENARVVFGQLTQILQNIGTILTAVFSAAASVGGNFLTTITTITGAAADFAQSIGGFQAFQAIFATLRDIGQAVAPILKALLGVLGQVIGAALPALTPLLNVISTLAVTLINALGPAILALKPLLDGLVTGLVGLLQPLQPIIVQLGGILTKVIGPIAVALGDLFAQLGPVLGELVAGIATALMPILEALAPIITSLLGQIQPLIPAIIQLIPPITQLVLSLTPLIEVFAQLLVFAIQVQAPLVKLLTTFIAFLTTKAIVPFLNLLVAALNKILPPIRAVLGPLREFGGFLDNLTFEQLGEIFQTAFDRAAEIVAGFIVRIKTFFTALPDQIVGFLKSLPGLLANAFSNAVSFTFRAIGAAIGKLISFFIAIPGRAVAAVQTLGTLLGNFFTGLWARIQLITTTAISALITFVTGLPARIVAAVQALPGLLASFFTNLWNRVVSITQSAVTRVVDFVRSLPTRIAEFGVGLFNAGKALIGKLLDGLVSIGARGLGFVEQIGRALKRFINDNVIGALERGLNDNLPFDISLPRLAKGALVTSPTVALLAEKGPEVVIPLSDPSRARELANESGLDRMVGTPVTPVVNIRVFLGTREIVDVLRTEVDEVLDSQASQINFGTRGVI